MQFYSTNHNAPIASLTEAINNGFASDGGLYLPQNIVPLPRPFFRNIAEMPSGDLAYVVANTFLSEDFEPETVREIVNEALTFPLPVKRLDESGRVCVAELFHGPTMSVKDISARFMAALVRRITDGDDRPFHVIAATSGDAGSAVAEAFHKLDGVKVTILYPKGWLTPVQKLQLTSLGEDVTAIEVRGSFDDCQNLVKAAAMDENLKSKIRLIDGNSINIARFISQTFHFFNSFARMLEGGADPEQIVMAVPSGNLGNMAAGLMAKRLGLPVKRFIAATNDNDVFARFIAEGVVEYRPTLKTFANAMDTAYPTNLPRVNELRDDVDLSVTTVSDDRIIDGIKEMYARYGYICDPHGACGYVALDEQLKPEEYGVFMATASPQKCSEVVFDALGEKAQIISKKDNRRQVKAPVTAAPIYQSIKEIITSI